MVIDEFDIKCISLAPNKAYPPLLVDTNGVLTLPIAFQRLKMISGRHPQIFKSRHCGDQEKLVHGTFGDIKRNRFFNDAARQLFRAAVFERLYHATNVAKYYTLDQMHTKSNAKKSLR